MRLSDTQLILLSEASNRDDRGVVIPDRLKGAATAKVVAPLLKANLIEEIAATGSLPVWRRDEDGAPHALTITDAGLTAIHADDPSNPARAGTARPSQSRKVHGAAKESRVRGTKASPTRLATRATSPKGKPRASAGPAGGKKTSAPKTPLAVRSRKGRSGPVDSRKGAPASAQTPPREGSKLASLVALLGRRQGASIDEITTATGWLPHTARAALTGLRKRGFEVARSKEPRGRDSRTIYRIGS